MSEVETSILLCADLPMNSKYRKISIFDQGTKYDAIGPPPRLSGWGNPRAVGLCLEILDLGRKIF